VSIGREWLNAFPIRPATEAVDALCESWDQLTRHPLAGFHPGMKEPDLTRTLKAHVESVTARSQGLLGMWAAENVINVLDPVTAEICEERRNDIVYGWNDETTGMQLVFEFKKMSCSAADRKHYLGTNGLERFVSGIYSPRQPVAAMVGILIDPIQDIVPSLITALSAPASKERLRLRLFSNGAAFERPSILFARAEFDTEHERDAALAPTHGKIRIAHIFLKFGYSVAQPTRRIGCKTTVKRASTRSNRI